MRCRPLLSILSMLAVTTQQVYGSVAQAALLFKRADQGAPVRRATPKRKAGDGLVKDVVRLPLKVLGECPVEVDDPLRIWFDHQGRAGHAVKQQIKGRL